MSLLDMLTEIYNTSQVCECNKCHQRIEGHGVIKDKCRRCGGKFIHLGEAGKSVEGSFQWYIARAKGEKV